ncbi:hypothetical protein A3K87_04260 [Variovorax paradoxus]|uniref:Uncharacterized protein n=1 Tax=Variovorax paradoxus TaxID=34073 RepID=A0AA91I7D7_VARPD|nr:hypothetical protein [Variovorax paradoxus]OAK55019.1 hypothetical protein A3K87_04260 [Variovorax paradoxus]
MATQQFTQTTTEAPHGLLPVTISELPDGARALLVSIDSETHQFTAQPIVMGDSVLNIKRDLLKHLNEYPHTTEWLEVLRDYCSARLGAEAKARASGRFVTPSTRMDWDMTSILFARGMRHG